MHNAKDVKDRLLNNIESVCSHLLPGGKVKGAEYRCADINGGPGKNGGSLSVALRGEHKGLWRDYADATMSGDIIDLWCQTQNVTFRDGFADMCRYVGITNLDRPKPRTKPPAPDRTGLAPVSNTKVLQYLQGERGLSVGVLKDYRIRSHSRPSMDELRAARKDKRSVNPDTVTNDFVAFQFSDSEGEPVMLKSTGITPTAEGKKDTWSTSPYYTLWGWWLVEPSDRSIIITEGEYDAMSVAQLDPEMPVLSLPAGSSNLSWIENDYDALARFEKIYICTDMDDAGETCAQQMAIRLGRSRCFRLKIPGGFKDANECLVKGEPEDIDFGTWMAGASSYDPPSLRGARAFQAEVIRRVNRTKAQNDTNTFVFPSMRFQLRPGECTLLHGYTGHGKSEIMYQIHAHEMATGNPTVIASFEIQPDEMIVNLGTQLLGQFPESEEDIEKVMSWLDGKLWFVTAKDDDKKPSVTELFNDFDYAAARFGCLRFVIDSLMFLVKKDDYEAQDEVAKGCRNFCRVRQPESHVTLIAHSAVKRGEEKIPSMSDVQGSTGILAPFQNVVSVWRNVDKESKIEDAGNDEEKVSTLSLLHDGIIKVWKQRSTGERPRLKLWFNPKSKSFRTTCKDNPPPMITETTEEQEEF